MIRESMVYCATCDRCFTTHQKVAPMKWMIKALLKKEGWRCTEDDIICPDCIAKEVEE